MKEYSIINADIVLPEGIRKNSTIFVQDGIIMDIGGKSGGEIIDAKGLLLGPGLIDMHIHGAGSFGSRLDIEEDNLKCMCAFLEKHGITSFQLAASCDMDFLVRMEKLLKRSGYLSSHITGLYFEGPFINMEKKGGLPADSIRSCDTEYLDKLLSIRRNGRPLITTMTVAPELEGAEIIIEKLRSEGVLVAFGHSMADYETVKDIEEGHITHLFNAQRGLDHKKAGLALLPFMNSKISYELICDTVHVDADLVNFTINKAGSANMCLISDGMSFCGLGAGEGKYLGKDIYSDGLACYYKDSGTLIGSGCLITETGARLVRCGNLSQEEFFRVASSNPARVMKLADRGVIRRGSVADMILVDDKMQVKRVFKAENPGVELLKESCHCCP